MAVRLNILYTYDYGEEIRNHACDGGPLVTGYFSNAQDAINFTTNSIYQAYHQEEELYQDATECQHGHRVQFIIMEMVRISINPADDEDPVIETFDVYNHNKTYNQMIMEFFNIHDGVNRVLEHFI